MAEGGRFGAARNAFIGEGHRRAVETARIFLAILGLVFAVAGILVAWTFDRIAGLAVLLLGAFLLILPLITYRPDE